MSLSSGMLWKLSCDHIRLVQSFGEHTLVMIVELQTKSHYVVGYSGSQICVHFIAFAQHYAGFQSAGRLFAHISVTESITIYANRCPTYESSQRSIQLLPRQCGVCIHCLIPLLPHQTPPTGGTTLDLSYPGRASIARTSLFNRWYLGDASPQWNQTSWNCSTVIQPIIHFTIGASTEEGSIDEELQTIE